MSAKRFLLTAIAIPAAYLAGCGDSGVDQAASACLGDSPEILTALAEAPAEVRLGGETPISKCFVDGQEGGELANIGENFVITATDLNAAARENPSGPEALQLGYLVGAVQRGAEQTGGIHADLQRRLAASAGFVPPGEVLPQKFQVDYTKGLQAGNQSG
jgi:hypothetical protein